MTKPHYEEIINGHLVQVFRRRGFVQALVFSTDKASDEPVSDWEMPVQLRYMLEAVAKLAEAQTRQDQNWGSADGN